MLFVRFENIITVYNTSQIFAHCSFFEVKVITNKIRNSIFMLKRPHIQYVIFRNIPLFVEATPTVPVCF